MSKLCKGCGVRLQSEDKQALGYIPKADNEYCQRCFRLIHYNDVMISMQQGIDNDQLLHDVDQVDALLMWIVDVIDFESSIVKGMNRHFIGKDILLICTKSDLLPRGVNPNKIGGFLMRRLKSHGVKVQGIVMCPNVHKQDPDSLASIKTAMEQFRNGRDVVLLGNANAGKSTVLNGLLEEQALTTSIHPGTTLAMHPIAYEGYTLYDTPGMVNKTSLLTYLPPSQLKDVIFFKQLNPKKFQLNKHQSLAVGGYARLDILGCVSVSAICYFSDRLPVHRGKYEQADVLWQQHLGALLSPTIDTDFKMMKKYTTTPQFKKFDVVIAGLGWFCIQGTFERLDIYVHPQIDVIFREAMI